LKTPLRALTKKSVSLKKKKVILQKGGFLGSLLAPIASVVAPLTHTDSRRDCDRLWLWGVYEYTVSSFVSILYHCRAFASSERPCYSLSVWFKSDKTRDVTSFLWLDIRFRTISRKAHYMVLFKNLTDVSQIMALAH
jgi:hypothetical protein